MILLRLIPITAIAIVLLDQLSKLVIVKNLELHSSISVIPNLFNICLVHNYGAAWGMLAGQRWLLVVLPIVVCVVLWKSRKEFANGRLLEKLFLALFLGGMFGNLIDRLFRGYVVDFLDFHWGESHFPAFNIADSAICIGVFLYLLNIFISSLKKENKEEK